MTMPNFLVIGAAKSATTSLYHYLNQHPDIYMSSIKEPRFFAFEDDELDFRGPGDEREMVTTITRLEEYCALFDSVTNENAIGEASPPYLYISKAAERILHHIPNVKLIAILRNPVDRAFSSFVQKRFDGNEPLVDFTEAIRAEPARIQDNWSFSWHYLQRGLYYKQLKIYFDLFPRETIKVYLYEDFKVNAIDVLQDAFRFLNIHDTFVPKTSLKHRMSGEPKSALLHRFARDPNAVKSVLKHCLPEHFRKKLKRRVIAKNTISLTLSQEMRETLIEYYRTDVEKLEILLDRNLSIWMQSDTS